MVALTVKVLECFQHLKAGLDEELLGEVCLLGLTRAVEVKE